MAVFGIPTALFIIYSIAFLCGFVFLPLAGRALGGVLPLFLAETIANIQVRIAMTAVGEAVLTHTAAGQYELRYPSEDVSESVPKRWERFALGRFAIGYECSEDYVGDLHWPDGDERVQAVSDVATDGGTMQGTPEPALDRGRPGYAPHVRNASEKLLILTGEALGRFKDVGGLRGAQRASQQAEQEFGGNTADFSSRERIAGMLLFCFFGVAISYPFMF